jgi:hypothetical protein
MARWARACLTAALSLGMMSYSNAASGTRAVSVADSIQMTRLGDANYTLGTPSKGMVAKFSPDGKKFVVILRKGNLETNTNEYSILLFPTADVFDSPAPRVLISLASSSNRPAISNVLWLGDSDTILFLGERPGEQTQLYSLKCSSSELKKLTNSATNLTAFATTADAATIVFTAKDRASTFLTESTSRTGIPITNEDISDLIKGTYGGGEYDDDSMFIQRLGQEVATKVVTQGRLGIRNPEMALSPNGAHLVIQTEAYHVGETWREYDDKFLHLLTSNVGPHAVHTSIFQYELVDTRTGVSQVLIDTPIVPNLGSEVAWSPDSKSVVVSSAYLPLDGEDRAVRALRRAHTFLIEIRIPSRNFVEISQQDLRLLSWDPQTGYVTCDSGRIDSLEGKITAKAYFQKNGETWSKATAPKEAAVPQLPEIVLDEGMNKPPRLIAIDPSTGRRLMMMDLNPEFQNVALARVEEIAWRGAHRKEVKGGLYWPPGYVAGKKYPLVIQTHGWTPDRFWMDGPWTTAFAAQALAAAGIFVAQVPDPNVHLFVTSKEAPTAMAAYEGVVDYLNRRGLIDRSRVGVSGFSRTCWYVTYTLTHSKHRFAAAAIADGVDFSYFQYALDPALASEFEPVYGGPPYGKSLSHWLMQSPAFRMDKVEAPLRIQALGPGSVLGEWHWYTGLSQPGKPVEMIYIPEGSHILEKPWDRMISQQGNVDWFRFWLQGYEDPDPAKVGQYKRWRELRKLQPAQNSNAEAATADSRAAH